MPIVNMSVDILMNAINRGAATPLAIDDLPATITNIGTEVEEIAVMQQYLCNKCGRIIERTEAQGEPVDCPQCHADFRNDATAFAAKGENRVVRLDMLAARPDIYDPGGMARCIRGYLGIETGLIDYKLADATITVKVDPRLSDEKSYRPAISCAVLRNVSLDDEHIKILMNLQENLHWALGRDRKLASIGAYDLDTLTGDTYHYDAVAPDELKFVPLGFDPAAADSEKSPREILEQHGTGKKYARLLAGFDRYPLLRDGGGNVLSMPPIINSEQTRVTQKTKNIFIDVTGPSLRVVDRALNVMVTGLKELLPAIEIEKVKIEAKDGAPRITPNLLPTSCEIAVREAADTIGVPLSTDDLASLLERMGHRVETEGFGPDLVVDAEEHAREQKAAAKRGRTIMVHSPAWRNDIMHPIDLIEDAAVAFGYDNLPDELVPTFTVGQPRELEEQSALARRTFVGLGFHQVMTLGLTSAPAAFEMLGLPADPRAVTLENPISTEQTICRVSLIPGLMSTFAINKQHDLPQHLFEVGDVCFVDEATETGAREERFVAAAMIGTHVGYADIRAVCDALVHEFGTEIQIAPLTSDMFIAGRGAEIATAAGETIGRMGEIHPAALDRYGLRHPVSVLEISLAKLLSAIDAIAN